MSRKKFVKSKDFLDRLKMLMDYLGFSDRQSNDFANKIGISESSLSEILNFKTKLSASLIFGIANNLPEINLSWLLTGQGEITKPSGNTINEAIVDYGSGNSANLAAIPHRDLISLFKDQPRAKEINLDLLHIEQVDENKLEIIRAYIKGIKEGIGKPQHNPPNKKTGGF